MKGVDIIINMGILFIYSIIVLKVLILVLSLL